MPPSLSRRAVITGASAAAAAAVAFPRSAHAQDNRYAAFRLVRRWPDEPDVPEIILPEGYQIVPGDRYSVASRAEYFTFVQGPYNADGIEVEVDWPDVRLADVIHQDTHLRFRRSRHRRHRYTFTLPVIGSTINANQPTIQVWSHPDVSPGMYYRIEHNDPDRVAGPWTTVPWPAGAVKSVIHQLVAAHQIWGDSGMTETAAAKGHRFALMGFETNNTLHSDNPPHWHLSYNSGPDFGSPTHNPHFWIDGDGRNYYNGMDVTGLGRLKYYTGDPAPVYDFVGDANDGRGDLVVTYTLREDGGIDIAPADGPVYAIAAGRSGDLVDEVTVLRDAEPWLRVQTYDHVQFGALWIKITGLRHRRDGWEWVMRYDRLTGVLR